MNLGEDVWVVASIDSVRWHVVDLSDVFLIDVGSSATVEGNGSTLVPVLDLLRDGSLWVVGRAPSDQTVQRDDHARLTRLESEFCLLAASLVKNGKVKTAWKGILQKKVEFYFRE